jgi:hypothetical protein
VNRFIKLTDAQGEECFINVEQIQAITAAKDDSRGGSNIVFDFGSSMEVQESPERVLSRCRIAGQASTPEHAY